MPTSTVHDVAKYILQKNGQMTTMKLQKLVYYCQAWSLVWDDAPLFKEEIQAWANGPVVRELYDSHKGRFQINDVSKGDASNLSANQRETVDAVLKHYGDKPSQYLIDLSHSEKPWQEARGHTPIGENCETVISHASMAEYYGSLKS